MFDDLKRTSNSDKKDNLIDDNKQDDLVGEMAMDDVRPSKGPVDDMFGDVDPVADKKASALQSGKIKSVSQTGDPAAMAMPQDLKMDQVVLEKDDGAKIKKIAAMVISVLFLAAVATVIYAYFFNNTENVNDPVVVQNDNVDEKPVVEEKDDVPAEEQLDLPVPIDEEPIDEDSVDYDGDSLSNSEEEALGTDPLEPDTDNDGVFDWDEVKLYESDPLEPDTDGDGLGDYDEIYVWGTSPNEVDTDNDGFGDGVEVANGYNPFGEGDIEDFVAPDQRGIENN